MALAMLAAMTSHSLAESSAIPAAWCNDAGAKLTFLNDGENGVTLAEHGKRRLNCGWANGPDGTVINCDGWSQPKVVFTVMSEPRGLGRSILIFENAGWFGCKP